MNRSRSKSIFRRPLLFWSCGALVLLVWETGAAPARAARVNKVDAFAIKQKVIHDDTGLTSTDPSINNFGEVAFQALDDEGEQAVLYTSRSSGGMLLTINGLNFGVDQKISGPVIGDSGDIAFMGRGQKADVYVWKVSGSAIITIRGESFGQAAIDGNGQVAFQGVLEGETDTGLYLYTDSAAGGAIITIFGGNWLGSDPGMSSSGVLAATRSNSAATKSDVYVWKLAASDPPLETEGTEGIVLGAPSVNNNSTVVVTGGSDLATDPSQLFRLLDGGSLEELEFDPALQAISQPALNNLGDAAFLATPNNGVKTLYFARGLEGAHPVYDTLLAVGDDLLGRTIEDLHFTPNGLNDSLQLVLFASFTDGSQGVFLFSVVPEPSACVLFALGVLGLSGRRTRRRC